MRARNFAWLTAAALICTSLYGENRRPMTVEDVLSLESLSSPRMSPDGRWVAYVLTRMDFDENVNDSDIWVVSAAGEAAAPVRLTSHRGADGTPRWAPDSSWLAFISDRSGSRQAHAIRPDGGEAWSLTEPEDWPSGIDAVAVSPDGQSLAIVARPAKSEALEAFERERGRPQVWDDAYQDEWSHLWLAPLTERRPGEARRLSPDGVFVTGAVFSPDSKAIAFAGRPRPSLRSRSEMDVYVVPVTGGEPVRVTQMPGGETPVGWTESAGLVVSATGKRLGTFNRALWRASPAGEDEPVRLTAALDENATYIAAPPDGLYVEASAGTGRGLFRVSKTAEPLSASGFASSFSMSGDGSRTAFLFESGASPPNVFVSSTSGFEPRQLTHHNSHVESRFELGEQRVVSWSSRADGERIEGVLNLPTGYVAGEGERVPLLLVIHGGPSGVSSDRFSPRRGAYPVQVFTGMGYAVLQPNYRGSTGYGERFRGLNRGDISGRDWVDIDSGVDALVERGIADPERLGVMGWSFGGHHTFWGITQTERFKAASAGAGANDLISMYSQTDLPEFYHTYLGPKPWEDFELYEERSAYRFVDRVTTPLLIQVGERDERVPAEQSIQFYEAVRAIGKAPVELVVYPGQPHGVREPRLVRDLLTRNVEWFERWIPTEGPVSSSGAAGANAR